MFRGFLFIFIASNFCFSQSIKSHIVYFDTNKYEVIETEQNRLLLFVQNLNKSKIKRISIYGFCDDRGTNQYNLVLSQERANSIKDILYEKGVGTDLITNVDGRGEVLIKVVESKNLNIIRGLNRKVEISVEYKKNPPLKNKNFDLNSLNFVNKFNSKFYELFYDKKMNTKIKTTIAPSFLKNNFFLID